MRVYSSRRASPGAASLAFPTAERAIGNGYAIRQLEPTSPQPRRSGATSVLSASAATALEQTQRVDTSVLTPEKREALAALLREAMGLQ